MRPPPETKAGAARPGDPLSRAAYVLVLVAVPLVTCNALRATTNVTYGDIALALAAVFAAAVWLRRGHPRGVVPRGFLVGWSVILAVGLLSSMATESAGSLESALRFSVALGVMPLIVMIAASTPHRIQRAVDAWLLAAAANSAVGALDLLGVTNIGMSLTSVDFVTFTDRASGLTYHPNHLGLVTAMALPVAIARLGSGGLRGLAAMAIVPLLIVGVVESGSRGALLAAVASAGLVFILGVRTERLRMTVLMFAAPIVTFALLVAVLGHGELTGAIAFERLGGGGGAAQSDQERIMTLRQSLDQAGEHALVGEGFAVVRSAHNIYLQLLQAGGVLALLGFLVFAWSTLLRTRWLALSSNGSPSWLTALAAGTGASISVWLLFGLVGNAIYDRYLYVPVGVVLALSLVHVRIVLASDPTTSALRVQSAEDMGYRDVVRAPRRERVAAR